MPSTQTDPPSRPLTHAEIRRCRVRLKRPRTLHSCWSVGRALDAAQGRRRAEFGRGTLRRYAQQVGATEHVLRHLLRLARHWAEREVLAAQRAGLGFRAAQVLAALDSHGQSGLRRRLVEAFCRGRLDRPGLFRRIRAAKTAGPDRLKPGVRLRALLDLRRAVTGRLKQALRRLDADPEVWPREERAQVKRLKARLEQAQGELERMYVHAAERARKSRQRS
ncbi:MAG: hypothetical protein AMXMBFR7_42850 [Planctomycetota bacterium]